MLGGFRVFKSLFRTMFRKCTTLVETKLQSYTITVKSIMIKPLFYFSTRLNAISILLLSSSEMLYSLPVAVVGTSTLQRTCSAGTQQTSSFLGHRNPAAGPCGCMKTTS